MRKLLKKEFLILALFIVVGLFIRSLHYSTSFNFSTDQASFASKSLEIWRNKKITLIGPSISFNYIGREVFQGSITYYFNLLFLLPSKFDPLTASYLFTVFATLMVLPLYYGVKMLVNKKAALVVSILYILCPLYIDYTRFLWNPNFQLSLTPLPIFFMGLFTKKKKLKYFFVISFLLGLLLLFHYQYVLVIAGLGLYYFVVKKLSFRHFALFILGLGLGFSPIIIFELRNNFYNLQTLYLYLTHSKQALGVRSFNIHYYLSICLFFLLILVSKIRNKINHSHIVGLFVILFVLSLGLYGRKPTHAFGMANDWNYMDEKLAHEIIKKQNLQNFNIVNQGYDTVATVQKYLLKTEETDIQYYDYYHNKYLFVITNRKRFMEDSAYEVNSFKPSIIEKNWKINDVYMLYLLKRT